MKQKQLQFCNSNRLNGLVQLTGCLFILLFFAGSISAQVSTLKLSTTDNTSYFDVTDNLNNSILRMRGDGKLGINQNTPLAGLHLVSNDGLLVQGTWGSGNTLTLGAGTRMHWYSVWGAFRVGSVTGTQWDEINVGVYSFASGYNTIAKGQGSTAMGDNTTASGMRSTAIGYNAKAIGYGSTAIGDYTYASGNYSTAFGNYTSATGDYSTAMGDSTLASGYGSTAMGNNVGAQALGSFIIGDNSVVSMRTAVVFNNQMVMRFAQGYRLFTSSDLSNGVWLVPGGNSWASWSDSTKKENFKGVDGEYFLNSISKLRLDSWNYKKQDPKKFRHYGPIAQEIYYYFGNDGVGVIGADTMLTSADMDGIEMIALQSLVKRTDELRIRTNNLQIAQERVEELEIKLASQKKMIEQLLTEFKSVKNAVSELKKDRSNYSLKAALLNKDENYGNPSLSEGTLRRSPSYLRSRERSK